METRIDVNDESSESTTSLKRYITASTRKEDMGTRDLDRHAKCDAVALSLCSREDGAVFPAPLHAVWIGSRRQRRRSHSKHFVVLFIERGE